MALHLQLPDSLSLTPKILVVGVGGAGGNAVNNMISAQLEGADFIVANTDAQALDHSLASRKVQLGAQTTKGLGAGAAPQVGRAAAEESLEELRAHLEPYNMIFVTAGMGGGTGTGAAPVVAQIAKEMGILTVAVVTKPFHFEGARRMRMAEQGLEELHKYVDTLLIIPNQNLFRVANERTTFADAFKIADDVLHAGVRGVTDLMVMPGLINLDFADIRTVMSEMGKAMMGTGEASGENRAIQAAEAAISNPLLDNTSMKGARGVLINITGGNDLTLFEVDEAANRIREEVDPNANIIFGSTFNKDLDGGIRVSVVATGIDAPQAAQPSNPAAVNDKPASFAAPRAAATPAAPASPKIEPNAASPFPPVAAANDGNPQASYSRIQQEIHQTLASIQRSDYSDAVHRVNAEYEASKAAHRNNAAESADTFIAPAPIDPGIYPGAMNTQVPVSSAPSVAPSHAPITESSSASFADDDKTNGGTRGFFSKVANVARSLAQGEEEPYATMMPPKATITALHPYAGARGNAAEAEKSAAEVPDDLFDVPAFLRRKKS